jgi:hypothetical protein
MSQLLMGELCPYNSTIRASVEAHACCSFLDSAWMILGVNWTVLRDAKISGKALFLGVFVKVFPGDTSISISRPIRDDHPYQFWWASPRREVCAVLN